MTNTTTYQTTYTVALTVDNGFSAFTIGRMIADAMATMQDEPFGTNFDPYWDGPARIALPLVYAAPGIAATEVGTLTITAPGAVECPGFPHLDRPCGEVFHTTEDLRQHFRAVHVQVGGPVD